MWGASFLFIELALESFTPLGITFLRGALGALSLGVVLMVVKHPLPTSLAHWKHIVVVALLLNTVPGFLFALGQQWVPSALAGIINATTPLMTVLVIALAFRDQKPRSPQVWGIAVGLLGVTLVSGALEGTGGTSAWGVLILVGATLSYGVAMPYAKRYVSPLPYSAYSLATAQVGASALVSLVPALLGGITTAPITASALWGILALGILGTGFAYVWNYQNIEKAGSVIASSVTYITPVVAVILGALFLGERLTVLQLIGGVGVLTSAVLIQMRLPRRRARAL